MIIICGKNIREVEQNLEMAKMAMASGMPCGVGGSTIADVENALRMMEHMGLPTAISNPNYDPDPAPWFCPDCGEMSGYDAETDSCENCGRGYEDEYPYGDGEEEEESALPLDIQRMIMAFAEMLNAE